MANEYPLYLTVFYLCHHLKRIFSPTFHATDDPIFKLSPLGLFGIGGGIGGIVDKNIEVGFGAGQVEAEPISHAVMRSDDKDFAYVGVFVRRQVVKFFA